MDIFRLFPYFLAIHFSLCYDLSSGSLWTEEYDTQLSAPDKNHEKAFKRNSDAFYDDVDYYWGSGQPDTRSLHDAIMQNKDRRQLENLCVINLDKADVIFAVDVGTNLESSAVDSVKDFIMSTLKVMELEEDKIRVGIYTMGARNESINELLSLKSGISHRAVQESLNGLTIGDDPFDYSSVLRKIEGSFSDQRNVTKIIISVLSTYIVETDEVRTAMQEIGNKLDDVLFYHVRLGMGAVTSEESVDSILFQKNLFHPSIVVVSEMSYWSLARSLDIAKSLMKRFGCNHCLPNPCDFGASCLLTDSGHLCTCPPGYVSGVCTPCQSNPCKASRCLVSESSYLCDTCNPNPCRNEGKCIYRGKTSSVCVCPPNYVGDHCEFPCPDCRNGGTCKHINGSAACECLDGYIGENCDLTCSMLIACLNGGTCGFNDNRDPICNCPEPFNGLQCENLCDLDTCKNGGSCGVANRSRFCYCPPRYEGQFCEIDRCESYFRCKNGGVCQVNMMTNRVECACLAPYSGADCSISPCTDFACFNGGSCLLDENSQPYCNCTKPYLGEKCLDNYCSSNPCLNEGTCFLNSQQQVSCKCMFGFYGWNCMNNPCKPSRCDNGGLCLPKHSGAVQDEYIFECLCPVGFNGLFCQNKITTIPTTAPPTTNPTTSIADFTTPNNSACFPNPCHEPCQCLPSCKHENGYVCVSEDGKLGKNCSIPPPSLICGNDAIIISIDDGLLQELKGNVSKSAYFAFSLNEPENRKDCSSTLDVDRFGNLVHRLILTAPFTSCGASTSINNTTASVTNKVWFNIESYDFDMPVPVFTWKCDFQSTYKVVTSIEPVIDSKMEVKVTKKNQEFVSAQFQLCKATDTCIGSCPSHLVVKPGAIYTVGQQINIILKSNQIAGRTLHLIDFFMSCGQQADFTPTVKLVSNGCQSNHFAKLVSKWPNTSCIIFKLPLLRGCNLAYLHAKLSRCPPTSECANVTTNNLCSFNRGKRAVVEMEKFGPIYILQSKEAKGKNFNSHQLIKKPTNDIRDRTSNAGLISSAIILSVCVFIFFVLFFLNRYRNRKSFSLA